MYGSIAIFRVVKNDFVVEVLLYIVVGIVVVVVEVGIVVVVVDSYVVVVVVVVLDNCNFVVGLVQDGIQNFDQSLDHCNVDRMNHHHNHYMHGCFVVVGLGIVDLVGIVVVERVVVVLVVLLEDGHR